MYARRDWTYTEPDEAIDVRDGRTIKGYGRPDHGLYGKDADLGGGQIVVTDAFWYPGGVQATAYAYATEAHDDCEACEYGDCDGVEIIGTPVTVTVEADTEDEEEALHALYNAITTPPTSPLSVERSDAHEDRRHS